LPKPAVSAAGQYARAHAPSGGGRLPAENPISSVGLHLQVFGLVWSARPLLSLIVPLDILTENGYFFIFLLHSLYHQLVIK
jgi:hypothetical protein